MPPDSLVLIFPIETPQPRFHLARTPRLHDRLKLVKEPLDGDDMQLSIPNPALPPPADP